MKKLLIALVLVSQYSIAQTLEWGTTIGGAETEHARKVKTDSNGNVYLTGYFSGTTDFDPSSNTFELTSAGEEDIFVQKLDANGNFVWARSFGGDLYDQARNLHIDSNNNLLLTGQFEGTADFDPSTGVFNLTSNGETDIFILKLDANGNLVWATSMGSDEGDQGAGIYTDTSGNVFTSGVFQSTVDFDPGSGSFNVTASGLVDTFVLKLNAQGDFDWVRTIEGNNQNSVSNSYSISLNNLSEIAVSGIYSGTIDVDPGVSQELRTSNGQFDFFVIKLDTEGNYEWANTLGSTTASEGVWSAKFDSQGNIYVGGYFQGTVDFDPGPDEFLLSTIGETNSVYIQKIDSEGNLLWVHALGRETEFAFARSYDLTVDEYDNPIVLIKFSGTMDFNPGPNEKIFTSIGGYDAALVKLNPSGGFKWAGHMGGSGSNLGLGIHSDKNGNLYTTGYFLDTIDLDPSEGDLIRNSSGQKDLFVNKLSNPNLAIENSQIIPDLVVYPNPTTGQIIITTQVIQNEVSIRIYNSLGQQISHKTELNTDQIQLEINQPSGIYLLEIITNSWNKTVRIIKN